MKKTAEFYKYERWHRAYIYEITQSVSKDCLLIEDVFIAANFISALGYGEKMFDHISDIQAEWEKCDDDLKAAILSGWQIMEAEAQQQYDDYLTHDGNGNKLDPDKNINLS